MSKNHVQRLHEELPDSVGEGVLPSREPRRAVRLIFLILSVLTFVIALACPALEFEGVYSPHHRHWEPGWGLLLFGWAGVFYGCMFQFAWFANPLLFIGWIFLLLKQKWWACLGGSSAFLVALQTLQMFSKPVPGFEQSSDSTIMVKLGAGFYFWTATMLLVVVGALCCAGQKGDSAVLGGKR